jgi:hypothetical protein
LSIRKPVLDASKAANKIVIILLLSIQLSTRFSKAKNLKNIETPAPTCVERLNILWYDSLQQILKFFKAWRH